MGMRCCVVDVSWNGARPYSAGKGGRSGGGEAAAR